MKHRAEAERRPTPFARYAPRSVFWGCVFMAPFWVCVTIAVMTFVLIAAR